MGDKDICPHCKQEFDSDDVDRETVKGAYEFRGEFWGTPCSEWVPYSFCCPKCGERIDI